MFRSAMIAALLRSSSCLTSHSRSTATSLRRMSVLNANGFGGSATKVGQLGQENKVTSLSQFIMIYDKRACLNKCVTTACR
jgi:hypothetical protein